MSALIQQSHHVVYVNDKSYSDSPEESNYRLQELGIVTGPYPKAKRQGLEFVNLPSPGETDKLAMCCFYRNPEVCIAQVQFGLEIPFLYEGFQGLNSLHFEMLVFHILIQLFQIEYWSLSSILLWDKKDRLRN